MPAATSTRSGGPGVVEQPRLHKVMLNSEHVTSHAFVVTVSRRSSRGVMSKLGE